MDITNILTVKPLPRYCWILRALAGDSTTTRPPCCRAAASPAGDAVCCTSAADAAADAAAAAGCSVCRRRCWQPCEQKTCRAASNGSRQAAKLGDA